MLKNLLQGSPVSFRNVERSLFKIYYENKENIQYFTNPRPEEEPPCALKECPRASQGRARSLRMLPISVHISTTRATRAPGRQQGWRQRPTGTHGDPSRHPKGQGPAQGALQRPPGEPKKGSRSFSKGLQYPPECRMVIFQNIS